MKVDTAGTGRNLVDGTVSKNGQKGSCILQLQRTSARWKDSELTYVTAVQAPTSTGTEQITAALPANAKCAGGAAKNLCLVSFTSVGGFGNCVVIQQDGAASNGNTTAAASATDGNAASSAKGNAFKGGKTAQDGENSRGVH